MPWLPLPFISSTMKIIEPPFQPSMLEGISSNPLYPIIIARRKHPSGTSQLSMLYVVVKISDNKLARTVLLTQVIQQNDLTSSRKLLMPSARSQKEGNTPTIRMLHSFMCI